ncbi:MAG: DUF1559 domain-containing protein [Planctomycetaceae bacterium]
MHSTSFKRRAESRRSGISLLELLVILAIVSVILALLLPAIGTARTAARKVQCQNNLKNIAIALLAFHDSHRRFPASGLFHDPDDSPGEARHSWAVTILPHLDQGNLHERWTFDKSFSDPVNEPLAATRVPVFLCPIDISRSRKPHGDLSYAVNGGWGFTTKTGTGVRDCPIDWQRRFPDLNGDGQVCSGDDAVDDLDRGILKKSGMYFPENSNPGGTVRHHSLNMIRDGASQTFLVGENVRTGFDPKSSSGNFANPSPLLTTFFVGIPCPAARCSDGSVNHELSNAAENAINSGLWAAEGSSPVPNSFHEGGVNMAYADGRVSFLNESIDGGVYAALASPQGTDLDDTPLRQSVVSDLR